MNDAVRILIDFPKRSPVTLEDAYQFTIRQGDTTFDPIPLEVEFMDPERMVEGTYVRIQLSGLVKDIPLEEDDEDEYLYRGEIHLSCDDTYMIRPGRNHAWLQVIQPGEDGGVSKGTADIPIIFRVLKQVVE